MICYQTPWGIADHIKHIGQGMLQVSTPSHGGIILTPQMSTMIPKELKSQLWIKDQNEEECLAFEEDCDAVIPLAVLWPFLTKGYSEELTKRGFPREYFIKRVKEHYKYEVQS